MLLTKRSSQNQLQCMQEWHHVAQHPSLWETLDLRNRQDAGAWLSRLQVKLSST